MWTRINLDVKIHPEIPPQRFSYISSDFVSGTSFETHLEMPSTISFVFFYGILLSIPNWILPEVLPDFHRHFFPRFKIIFSGFHLYLEVLRESCWVRPMVSSVVFHLFFAEVHPETPKFLLYFLWEISIVSSGILIKRFLLKLRRRFPIWPSLRTLD